MKRLALLSVLTLSACGADWCSQNRDEIATCLELKRQGQRVECACQTQASGAVAVTPDKPDRPKPDPVYPGDDDHPEYPDHDDPDRPHPHDHDGPDRDPRPEPHDHSEPGDDGGVRHDADDPRYH